MAGFHKDKVLEALEEAVDIWEKTVLANRSDKLAYAHVLWRYEHFSLPQIAKIVRLNARYVYEELIPNGAKGGRFDPQTLSTLARIRRALLQGERVPDALVRMGIMGGTSFTCMTVLTGLSYGAYYDVARKAAERAEQETLKGSYSRERDLQWQKRREEFFKLREQGLNQYEIERVTGVDQSTVSKVLRGVR